MPELTVKEAAERLGISVPRVHQLIVAGSLSAQKVGGMWFVDQQSVESRLSCRVQPGRPAHAECASEHDFQSFTLMNGRYEVLRFRYDAKTGQFGKPQTDDVIDALRAPLGMVSSRSKTVSQVALARWWGHRGIPASREGLAERLALLGIDYVQNVPFESLGLSLSDQYWVRPDGKEIRWEDVNYFDNAFDALPEKGEWLDEVGLNSPDNTSEGQLSKAWVCRGARRVLLKGGSTLNQEPYNEAVATALYRRLLLPGEYVPYELFLGKRGTVSLCEDFVSHTEEYIPAYYVAKSKRKANHHNEYQHYLECCASLGVENAERSIAKMLVCDDILLNEDRHWRNFGIVRDVETLACRIAPLFDAGNSLLYTKSLQALKAGDASFCTKPFYADANRQLRLVSDYDWFDPQSLDGFADEAAAVLLQNEALAQRVDFICEAIQGRIDRIVRML